MKLRGDERKVKVLEEICGAGTSEDHTDVTNTASISNQRNSGMFPADKYVLIFCVYLLFH